MTAGLAEAMVKVAAAAARAAATVRAMRVVAVRAARGVVWTAVAMELATVVEVRVREVTAKA